MFKVLVTILLFVCIGLIAYFIIRKFTPPEQYRGEDDIIPAPSLMITPSQHYLRENANNPGSYIMFKGNQLVKDVECSDKEAKDVTGDYYYRDRDTLDPVKGTIICTPDPENPYNITFTALTKDDKTYQPNHGQNLCPNPTEIGTEIRRVYSSALTAKYAGPDIVKDGAISCVQNPGGLYCGEHGTVITSSTTGKNYCLCDGGWENEVSGPTGRQTPCTKKFICPNHKFCGTGCWGGTGKTCHGWSWGCGGDCKNCCGGEGDEVGCVGDGGFQQPICSDKINVSRNTPGYPCWCTGNPVTSYSGARCTGSGECSNNTTEATCTSPCTWVDDEYKLMLYSGIEAPKDTNGEYKTLPSMCNPLLGDTCAGDCYMTSLGEYTGGNSGYYNLGYGCAWGPCRNPGSSKNPGIGCGWI